jgi:hypothetical protein
MIAFCAMEPGRRAMSKYIYQTFKYCNYSFLIFADQDKHNHELSNSMSAKGKVWVAKQADIDLKDLEMPTYKSNQSKLPKGDTIEASSPKKNEYSFSDKDGVIAALKKEKEAVKDAAFNDLANKYEAEFTAVQKRWKDAEKKGDTTKAKKEALAYSQLAGDYIKAVKALEKQM